MVLVFEQAHGSRITLSVIVRQGRFP